MRALQFITGHVIYNPAYMYLQIPTENHQWLPFIFVGKAHINEMLATIRVLQLA